MCVHVPYGIAVFVIVFVPSPSHVRFPLGARSILQYPLHVPNLFPITYPSVVGFIHAVIVIGLRSFSAVGFPRST